MLVLLTALAATGCKRKEKRVRSEVPREAASAPAAATAVTAPVPFPPGDSAGRWMLYGRHVIDLEDGVLVATLAEEALAIDELGRVLVPAAPGVGPLQWKKP